MITNNKMASFPYKESISMAMDSHVDYFKTEAPLSSARKLGKMMKANLARRCLC